MGRVGLIQRSGIWLVRKLSKSDSDSASLSDPDGVFQYGDAWWTGTDTLTVVDGGALESASYPNEPAGATSVTGAQGWAFDWSNVVAKNPPETAAQPWEGIYFQGAWGGDPCDECQANPAKASTVANQSGPVNPTTVGRYIYNSSNAPSPFGDALIKPSSFNIFVPPNNVVKIYISMWIKFSSGWFFAAGGMKLANIWCGAVSQVLIAEVRAAGTARAGYEGVGFTEPPYYLSTRVNNVSNQSLIEQIGGDQTAYFDNNPRIYNDTWYQVEFIWDWNTRFCELFLDGAKVADGTATSASWPPVWPDEFSIDGTFGGQCTGCPELPAEQYWYQDDFYMSYTT